MKRYIQDRTTHKLIPIEEYTPPTPKAPYVIQDSIDGFNAIATPDRPWIDSKTRLRQYCKANGLVMHEDCKGLPPQMARTEVKPDREGVRKELISQMREYR